MEPTNPTLPAGAVLLNQAPQEPAIDDLTFVDLTGLAFTKAGMWLGATTDPNAKREFALSKTALEEAVMRFNRGAAMAAGVFEVADLESALGLKLTPTSSEGGE